MTALKTWVGPGGGVWSVAGRLYEELWKAAEWHIRFANDPERAKREWDAAVQVGEAP